MSVLTFNQYLRQTYDCHPTWVIDTTNPATSFTRYRCACGCGASFVKFHESTKPREEVGEEVGNRKGEAR